MGTWEEIYNKEGIVTKKPLEEMKDVISVLKKQKVHRVLDLGCGTGRHTVLLAKEGFKVYALDLSKTGLKMINAWLKKEKLTAKLIHSSCYHRFPFKDHFFEAIISTQVIYHNYHVQIKKCIKEIERVLKPQGIIYITFAISKPEKADGSKKVDQRTYLLLKGQEKGIIHFFYTKPLIKTDFKNFKILKLKKDQTHHWGLLGQKN